MLDEAFPAEGVRLSRQDFRAFFAPGDAPGNAPEVVGAAGAAGAAGGHRTREEQGVVAGAGPAGGGKRRKRGEPGQGYKCQHCGQLGGTQGAHWHQAPPPAPRGAARGWLLGSPRRR
jgi:hypothetical protein